MCSNIKGDGESESEKVYIDGEYHYFEENDERP